MNLDTIFIHRILKEIKLDEKDYFILKLKQFFKVTRHGGYRIFKDFPVTPQKNFIYNMYILVEK